MTTRKTLITWSTVAAVASSAALWLGLFKDDREAPSEFGQSATDGGVIINGPNEGLVNTGEFSLGDQ